MKIAFKFLSVGALLGVAVGFSAAASAASPADALTSLLSGTAVSEHALANEHGKGITINGPLDAGAVTGNSSTGPTGSIANANSVNNNSGFTTVFQNTGNNSLFQSSTIVNITMH